MVKAKQNSHGKTKETIDPTTIRTKAKATI